MIGSAEGQAVLSGFVHTDSTKRPLGGVEILLEGSEQHTTTDAAGRFVLDTLAPGSRYFLVRSIGYEPIRFRVRLTKGDTVAIDVTMIPLGVRLDPIVVVAPPRGPRGEGLEAFEERRRMGFGKFIDSTELRRSEHLKLTDLLRRHNAFPDGRCLSVVLDGVRIRNPELRMFDIAHLEAVEVYRNAAQVPSLFGGPGGNCETLVLWTRRP